MEIINIYKWAKENHVIAGSAMPDLKTSGKFLTNLNINAAVEIGTAFGISAAHIAQYANKVHTFDIKEFPCRQLIWNTLKVNDKIFFYIIKGRSENGIVRNHQGIVIENENAKDIKTVLNTISFDFAFIDGRHDYENVKADFKLVKRCGRVMFHDTDVVRFKGVNNFVNEIGAKQIFDNVSYWEKDGR